MPVSHIIVIGSRQKPVQVFSAPVAMGKLARYKFKYHVKQKFPDARKVKDASLIGFHFIVNGTQEIIRLIVTEE